MGISLSYCVSRITESDLHIFPCPIFSTLAKPHHFVVLVRVLGHMLNNNQSQLFCSAASLHKKRWLSLWDKPEDRSKKRKKEKQKTEVRRRKGQKINRQKVRREVWMLTQVHQLKSNITCCTDFLVFRCSMLPVVGCRTDFLVFRCSILPVVGCRTDFLVFRCSMLPVVACHTDLDGPCYLSLAAVQIFLVHVTWRWLSYRFSWFMLPVVGCRTDFLVFRCSMLPVVQI